MQRRGAIVAALAAAGIALVVVALWFARPAPRGAAIAAPEAAAQPGGLGSSELATPAASAEAESRGASKLAVSVEPSESGIAEPASADELEVLVVAAATREPVAGAELVVCASPAAADFGDAFELALRRGEVDDWCARAVQRITTDAYGRARVSLPLWGADLVASAPRLWGTRRAEHSSASPLSIELHVDFSVDVRVVDASDVPAAGASVALRRRWNAWGWDVLTVRTDEQGRATLRHAGARLSSSGEDTNCAVALAEAVDPPIEVPIDVLQPPHAPITLRCAAAGECEVSVVGADGAPYLRPIDVELKVLPPDAPAGDAPIHWQTGALGSAMHERVTAGSTVFRYVTLDRELVVSAQRSGAHVAHSARVSGPSTRQARVAVTLRLGALVATVTGRALDDRGTPHARAKLACSLEYELNGGHVWSGVLDTDDQGRFEFDMEPLRPTDNAVVMTVSSIDADQSALASARVPLPAGLPAGTSDFGDIVLRANPLLASGVVLDVQGRPVRGARVTARVPIDTGAPGEAPFYEELWQAHARTDVAGRFALRYAVKSATVELVAALDDHKSEPREVAVGSAGVELVLGEGGELAGQVLLDPSVSAKRVVIVLRRADGVLDPDQQATEESFGSLDPQGEFAVRGLRPGRYDVELARNDTRMVLARVEGVDVRARRITRDARLDPLDLRNALFAVVLSVVDEQGQHVSGGTVCVRRAGAREDDLEWMDIENSKAVVFTGGEGFDAKLQCAGFLEHWELGVTTHRTVVMRQGPEVRFTLAGARAPEPPLYLAVRIVAAGEAETTAWWEGDERFDASGVVRTRAPVVGRVKLVVSLIKQDATTYSLVELPDDPPRIVRIEDRGGEQNFEVRVDAAKVEEYARLLEQ